MSSSSEFEYSGVEIELLTQISFLSQSVYSSWSPEYTNFMLSYLAGIPSQPPSNSSDKVHILFLEFHS